MEKKSHHRDSVTDGLAIEEFAGYTRAVRIDNRILVSGTTATGPDGNVVGAGDLAEQTRYILSKIERSIVKLGGSLRDVVRTRIYVRDVNDWEPAARVHGEWFREIRPANTLVQAALFGEEYLVEIEAEAIIGAGDAL